MSTVCRKVDLSPDKSLLAVACDAAVVIWDMKRVVKLEEFGFDDVRDLRFNPSGDKLIVGLLEGEILTIEMK